LPGTVTAHLLRESIIDSVSGLPPQLVRLISTMGPTIAPRESLDRLLAPEPAPGPGRGERKKE